MSNYIAYEDLQDIFAKARKQSEQLYTGVIDIEGNDGGYVVFDYNGQRYTYYNCYLESIANIEQ